MEEENKARESKIEKKVEPKKKIGFDLGQDDNLE